MWPSGPIPPRKNPIPPFSRMRGLVPHAELVHTVDHVFLNAFQVGPGLPHPQRQIHDAVGEDLLHRLPVGEPQRCRVDQHGVLRRQPEPIDVVLVHVPVEAVLLRRVHRVEFVDLHERQVAHLRLPGAVDAVGIQQRLDLLGPPPLHDPLHPLDEMLGRLAGGQGDHSAGVFQDPLDEPERGQFPEQGEVLHLDHLDAFDRGILFLPAAALQFHRFNGRGGVVCTRCGHIDGSMVVVCVITSFSTADRASRANPRKRSAPRCRGPRWWR